MLSEHFAASVSTTATLPKGASNNIKDVGISVFEAQPHSGQRASFKKSATNQNCLAVSASHIYAAQADKAVVHVYNREKGNQEATVPFGEKITCLALACEDTVLVLGSQTGRIFLWETHTGRLVITSQAHLQAVTAVAIDATSNFLLSASADASVHVWSLTSILSFANAAQQGQHTPLHTLAGHRAAITSLVVGHSASFCNIAVTASADQSCIIWDYHSNQLLRTVLLPEVPRCLALDPADRAFYTTFDDGSVQMVDFYSESFSAANPDSVQHPLFDEAQVNMPVQPPATKRWSPPSADAGAAMSAMLSYDGSTLMTGHTNGNVLTWDVPLGRYSSTFTTTPLPGPITNLVPLPVQGFSDSQPSLVTQITIVKPKHSAFDKPELDGAIPGNYNLSLQFTKSLPMPHISAAAKPTSPMGTDFLSALTHPSFPESLLAESLAELSTWTQTPRVQSSAPQIPAAASIQQQAQSAAPSATETDDFMSLDSPAVNAAPTTQQENDALRAEIAALKRVNRATLQQHEKLRKERDDLIGTVKKDLDRRLEDEWAGGKRSERAWKRMAQSGEYLESEDEK